MAFSQAASVELRRAYDALMELSVGFNTATNQAITEYRSMYLGAFQAYNRGDLERAECTARAVKHLCKAAWYDGKIKHLESHSEDVPHLAGPCDTALRDRDGVQREIESRMSRLKLTGLADRFGARARKHLQRIEFLSERDSLLAETYVKAAYEYCLATEALHALEFRELRAA